LLDEGVRQEVPDRPGYWPRIAAYVKTKSADECSAKYLSKGNYKTPTAQRSRKVVDEEVSPLHADAKGKLFKGTLKDKKKLRKIVSQSNKGHTDDVFDSTPFKNKDSKLDVSISEDELPEVRIYSEIVIGDQYQHCYSAATVLTLIPNYNFNAFFEEIVTLLGRSNRGR
jgi:hypothetical protein